jgi:hypothetical protein
MNGYYCWERMNVLGFRFAVVRFQSGGEALVLAGFRMSI